MFIHQTVSIMFLINWAGSFTKANQTQGQIHLHYNENISLLFQYFAPNLGPHFSGETKRCRQESFSRGRQDDRKTIFAFSLLEFDWQSGLKESATISRCFKGHSFFSLMLKYLVDLVLK